MQLGPTMISVLSSDLLALAGAHEEVELDFDERSDVHPPGSLITQLTHLGREVIAAFWSAEDRGPLAPPADDVVERSRRIQPRLPQHALGSAATGRAETSCSCTWSPSSAATLRNRAGAAVGCSAILGRFAPGLGGFILLVALCNGLPKVLVR